MADSENNISDEIILNLLVSQEASKINTGMRMMMNKYQERLYWTIRRMVVSHDDTDDVLQECFVKAYSNISKFRGKSKLYSWLYRIAVNETLSFISRKKRKTIESIDAENDRQFFSLKADSHFDGDSAQLVLQQAIHELPEKQRLVFNMRYFEEMPYETISEILGTTVGALKASYHHAVKKIHLHISEQGLV